MKTGYLKPKLKLNLVAVGMLALPLQLTAQDPIEGEELLVTGSEWEYLYYSDAGDIPADPADANPQFHTTWHTPAAYSGTPAFLSGPAMLGWGEVPNGAGNLIQTEIWGNRDGSSTPPSGQRFTCYLRTTFTPTDEVDQLRFESRVDDGAIIYLNGVEVARINVDGDAVTEPDTWMLFASGVGDEDVDVVTDVELAVPLPAGTPVDLAVSLHNASAGSSDIGFDTRVVSLIPPPPVPAPNDDFADAEVLLDPLPIAVDGRNDDTVGGSGSTKEAGEPDHAGDAGGASVWYTWTPDTTQRVAIATRGSDFDTLLAVYTGDTVGGLVEVASNDDATFSAGSVVEFEAQAGTTYRIAVDGNGGAFGNFPLSIEASPEPFDPTELLIAAGSNWDYLRANNTVRTVDPDAQDPDGDFYSTWHTAADYDGPAFQNGPALIGYGVIDADPILTPVFEPDPDVDPNSANAVLYLRSSFTPAAEVTNLAFRGIIDDGAIIYIDGVEVARLNVSDAADPNFYRATALSSNHGGINNEQFPQVAIVAISLPAGVPVEIGVSVHNASSTSSDLGFDIEVYSTTTPPPVESFLAYIAPTANPGEYEISWDSQLGAFYDVEYSPDLQTWTTVDTGVPGGATGTASSLQIPADSGEGFYRVRRQ